MLDIKNNFRNKYKDLKCRTCQNEDETQDHVMEKCPNLHINNEDTKVTNIDIFSQDLETLKATSNKIRKIMDILKDNKTVQLPPNMVERPGDPGMHT